MRRIITVPLVAVVAIVAVVALAGAVLARGDSSTVTRPRLERSLPIVFANLYTKQARMEGRTGVTPASLHAKAMCDKHGAENKDVGPGGDWVCLMSWTDPQVPMPTEGYGKFELNVHSNDCYTAGGPSKLTGFLTMTDVHGREVDNPVFEFDGCFDPNSSNTRTGVTFPSVLQVTSTVLRRDPDGKVGVQVTCGSGDQGCRGTLSATAGGVDLGTVPIDVQEESTATLTPPKAVPAGAKEVVYT